MGLFVGVLLSLLLAIVLRRFVVSGLARRLESESLSRGRRLRYAASCAVFSAASTIAFVIAGGLLLAVVLVLWAQTKNGITTVDLMQATEAVRRVREDLASLSFGWSIAACALLGLGILFHAGFAARRRMGRALDLIRDREVERIVESVRTGTLASLPPDPAMHAIADDIRKCMSVLTVLESDTQLPASVRERIRGEAARRLEAAQQAYVVQDIGRRAEAGVVEARVALPRPQTRLQRIQALLFSRGTVQMLGGGSRTLHVAAIVLLVIGSIGVGGGAVATGAMLEREIALTELALASSISAANAALVAPEEGGPKSATPAKPSPAELRQLATRLETWSLERVPVSESARAAASNAYHPELHRAEVKRLVLRELEPSTATRITGEELSPGPQRLRRAYAVTLGESSGTKFADRLAQRLETISESAPTRFERIRAWARALEEPVPAVRLRTALLGQILDLGVGAVGDVTRGAELQRAALEASVLVKLDEIGHGTGERSATAAADRLGRLVDALPATHEFRGRLWASLPGEIDRSTLLKLATTDPPAMAVAIGSPERVAAARAAVQETTAPLRAAMARRVAGSMRTFDDLLPRGPTAVPGLQEKFLEESGVEIGVRESAEGSFRRGRDFNSIRGFYERGGVAIGRRPAKATESFRNLRWEAVGDRIVLMLERADGSVVRSMPMDSEFVRRALAYAADGRLMPATITNERGTGEQQVTLHPAFVDSEIGAAILEVDHLVGRFAKDAWDRCGKDLALDEAVYSKAWLARARAIRRAPYLNTEDVDVFVAQFDGIADDPVGDEALRARARILAEMDGSATVLAAKPQYYDRELVAAIRSALPTYAADQKDLTWADVETRLKERFDRFVSGLKQKADRDAQALEGLKEDLDSLKAQIDISFGTREEHLVREYNGKVRAYNDLLETVKSAADVSVSIARRYLLPPPSTSTPSGVSEESFDVSAEGFGLTAAARPPQVLRFTVQVVFESPPRFGADGAPLEKTQAAIDSDPWEFPLVRDAIHTAVAGGVEGHTPSRAVVEEVTKFVQLQRLFRCALEGDLGDAFSLDSVGRLAQVLGPIRAGAATPRWWHPRLRAAQGFTHETHLMMVLEKPEDGEGSLREDEIVECRQLLKEHAEQWARVLAAAESAARGEEHAPASSLERAWAEHMQWRAGYRDRVAKLASKIEGRIFGTSSPHAGTDKDPRLSYSATNVAFLLRAITFREKTDVLAGAHELLAKHWPELEITVDRATPAR